MLVCFSTNHVGNWLFCFFFFNLYFLKEGKDVVSLDCMSMHEMSHWLSALVGVNAEFRLVLVWMYVSSAHDCGKRI